MLQNVKKQNNGGLAGIFKCFSDGLSKGTTAGGMQGMDSPKKVMKLNFGRGILTSDSKAITVIDLKSLGAIISERSPTLDAAKVL